jgi:antitoxin HigA-1
MSEERMPPVHPGEVLLEDFLTPMEISQYRVAASIGVHPRRINEIVHGNRRITADTALRLARFFGTSEELWMNLQVQYDLDISRGVLEGHLDDEVTPYAALA